MLSKWDQGDKKYMKPPRCIAHNFKENTINYRLCVICKNYSVTFVKLMYA